MTIDDLVIITDLVLNLCNYVTFRLYLAMNVGGMNDSI